MADVHCRMQHGIEGNVKAAELGNGHWRLYLPGEQREIHLRTDEFTAADLRGCNAVSVQWVGPAVILTIVSPQGTRAIPVSNARVHEPLPILYDCLPLARVDAKTRRFWRWVFRVVRLPGGRLLLGPLARRAK
jgi:hypothetical protein